MEKTPVPKFGSFKSKPKANEANVIPKDDDSHGSREFLTHRRRHERRSNSTINHSRDTARAAAHGISDDVQESSLYVVDIRGDSKNVEYGSIHRYDVPAHWRSGAGRILGMAAARIDRDASNDKEICLSFDRHHASRAVTKPLTSKKSHLRDSESSLRFVYAVDSSDDGHGTPDFLALDRSRKRKRSDDYPEGHTDLSVMKSRSSEGGMDVDSENGPLDLQSDVSCRGQELRDVKENSRLLLAAKADPTDLDSWLRLSDHQSTLINPTIDAVAFTPSERRTLANLRLSILADASKNIAMGHDGRERLLLAIIEEGARVWDQQKLAAKWAESLEECPTSGSLWLKYLDFEQHQSNSFHFEKSKEAHIRCLKILHSAHESLHGIDTVRIAKTQVLVLARLFLLFRDSGFDELAFAAWQVIMEYHFFKPPDLVQASSEQQIASLEDFWESETARIGEHDARGWCHWSGKRDAGHRRPSSKCQDVSAQSLLDAAKTEMRLTDEQWLPTSAGDDSVGDPFRYVMFSDVSAIVQTVSNNLPHRELLDAFLNFLGLPHLLASDNAGESISTTRFTTLPTNDKQFNGPDDDLGSTASITGQMPMHSRQESIESLCFDGFEPATLVKSQSVPNAGIVAFADRAICMLASRETDSNTLARYHIAFVLHFRPDEVSKVARKYLYKADSGLQLPNICALVEARLNNEAKAQRLWLTAISNRKSISRGEEEAIIIWHCSASFHLERGNEIAALRYMYTMTQDVFESHLPEQDLVTSSSGQLRVIRAMEDGFDRMSLRGKFEYAVLYADCHAIYCYITSRHDLETTIEIYSRYSLILEKAAGLAAVERLAQNKARLVAIHLRHGRHFRPVPIQCDLDLNLKQFPNNSDILAIRNKLASHDRIRALLSRQNLSSARPRTMVGWTAHIADELQRIGKNGETSNWNTVRAAFLHALIDEESSVRHVPFLWFWWLDFEHSLVLESQPWDKDEAVQRVKRVFLDGFRHIPWVKAWVIRGIEYLSEGGFTEPDMKRVYAVMVERGLRIRVEVDT